MAAKKNLVIVESPAKAKTIGKYLGPDYVVKASMGHLRDLPKSTLGVDVEGDFTPNYRPIKGKEDIIKDLKTTADKSKTVYLATDPDREGEAISWHLQHLLDLPDDKARRVTFNEITKKVVQESIQHPRAIDQDLVDAQQARRVLDRIVGYQLSPCCGRRSAAACPPAVCSRWRSGWWPSVSRRSRPSCPRSTGRWTYTCKTTPPRPLPPTTTVWTARNTSLRTRRIPSASWRS